MPPTHQQNGALLPLTTARPITPVPTSTNNQPDDSTNTTCAPPIITKETQLHFTIAGRTGHVPIQCNGVIFVEDLLQNLADIPSDIDDAKSNNIRSNRKMEEAR